MGKIRSRPIAFRPKPPRINYDPQKCWNGPFRFFDLPPELRDQILKLILIEWGSVKDTVHLFLTCQRIYAEAASIFYQEVVLDNMHLRGTADPFLAGPLTRVAPRQYVRNLVIRFTIKEQISVFGESYGTALQEMAEEGRLRHLRLEIGSCFPHHEFWGGVEDEMFSHGDIRIAGGKGKGKVVPVPLLVTKTPFQNFLKFLSESKIPKLTLFVDAEDHCEFWCMFHRAHPSGKNCEGQWKGKSKALKIRCSSLVKALKGARLVRPVKKEC